MELKEANTVFYSFACLVNGRCQQLNAFAGQGHGGMEPNPHSPCLILSTSGALAFIHWFLWFFAVLEN